MEERMLRWFDYDHLPDHLKMVSGLFAGTAVNLCNQLPPSAERTVALRKLLEAKDAAVRAAVEKHEQDQQEHPFG
jgi:predicted benzoate:H+ symporter BenE